MRSRFIVVEDDRRPARRQDAGSARLTRIKPEPVSCSHHSDDRIGVRLEAEPLDKLGALSLPNERTRSAPKAGLTAAGYSLIPGLL